MPNKHADDCYCVLCADARRLAWKLGGDQDTWEPDQVLGFWLAVLGILLIGWGIFGLFQIRIYEAIDRAETELTTQKRVAEQIHAWKFP